MEQMKFLRDKHILAVVFTLFSLWIGHISAIQLCQYGIDTGTQIEIIMDSLTIQEKHRMCSCQIQPTDGARLQMYAHLTIPDCSTNMSLSDPGFKFLCTNGRIESRSYTREKEIWPVLWLFVESSDVSKNISGLIQFKTTPANSTFTLECFDANMNTSSTTQIPTTTTTTTTTKVTSTITIAAITLKTQRSITSTSTHGQESSTISTAAETATYVTTSSSDGQPVSTSGPSNVNSPNSVDKRKGDKENEFPVAAVAGGIAGGLLLIVVVVLAVVCFRRRKREPNLLENGGPSSKNQCENRAYDSGVPPIGEMKPQNTQPLDNETHVHVENDLYASADADNHQPLPQVGAMNNVPDHYASPEDLNIDKSDVESVEGSEIVITSSGDLYAVVDKSKKHQDHVVTDPDSTGPSADVYAVVNKKQDPQDTDTTHTVSPSGDVYAVVDKSNIIDPTDIDATHMVSPSGDVYAVVDKGMGPQEKDVPDMVSPSPFVLPEADPDDQMTRATTHDDEEEEAIRRVMDMGDEREDSDTQQSTAL